MLAVIQHPNIPTRFVLGSDGQHDRMCCPVCACPYVHPADVVVEQGQTRTVVSNESTQVSATDRFLHARFADHAGFLVRIWALVPVRARIPQRRAATAA